MQSASQLSFEPAKLENQPPEQTILIKTQNKDKNHLF